MMKKTNKYTYFIHKLNMCNFHLQITTFKLQYNQVIEMNLYFSIFRNQTGNMGPYYQAGDTRIPLPRKPLWTPQKIVDCKVGLCTSLRTVAEFL